MRQWRREDDKTKGHRVPTGGTVRACASTLELKVKIALFRGLIQWKRVSTLKLSCGWCSCGFLAPREYAGERKVLFEPSYAVLGSPTCSVDVPGSSGPGTDGVISRGTSALRHVD